MMRVRAMVAGLGVFLASIGAGIGGCASEYDGYGWSVPPSSLEARDPGTPAPNGVLTAEEKKQLIESVTEMVRERAYATGVDFSKWPDHLKKHQARIDSATNMSQFSTAVNRALNEFGISHIDLMSPRQAQMQHTSEFGGIGVTRDVQASEAGIKIVDVRAGGPADKAGVKVGDIIVEVDGRKYEYDSIRGVVGTDVKLKILKADTGKTEDLTLKRVKLSTVQPPRLVKVNDEAAIVRLDSFTEGYDRRVVERVMREAADYPNLIIDLRSNGGGSVSNFIHFLGTLLPKGTEIGTFISRDMVRMYIKDTGDKDEKPDPVKVAEWTDRKVRINRNPVEPYAGKVAVLINGGSASASEIVAAAMREVLGAPLVGTPSAGAVLMSTYVKMDNGFEMKVPTSDYVTIKGLRIEGAPLRPDVRSSNAWQAGRPPAIEDDRPVQAALEALKAAASHAETPKTPAAAGAEGDMK